MVNLRKADAGDIEQVRAILAAAAADLTARFGLGHWSAVRSAESLRKYAGEGILYVAESGSAAVGTLRFTARKIGFYHSDWFERPHDPAGYLLDMAVHPGRQRRGIGRRCLHLVEDLARGAQMRAVRLDAYAEAAGAGAFYLRCGYALRHTGEMRGVRLEYFERTLPPPA